MREVEARSGGAFKASVLSGYERGDRAISLQRFWQLARFYGVLPDRLLEEIARAVDPSARTEVVLDLTRLPELDAAARRSVSEFAEDVRNRRGDHASDVITLRSGDLEVLAYELEESPADLAARLAAAARTPAGTGD